MADSTEPARQLSSGSLGLQAVHVASAAGRVTRGRPLDEEDTCSLGVAEALIRQSAARLRGEPTPRPDPCSYGFANLAVSILEPGEEHVPRCAPRSSADRARIAEKLESVALRIAHARQGDHADAQFVRDLFLRMSERDQLLGEHVAESSEL